MKVKSFSGIGIGILALGACSTGAIASSITVSSGSFETAVSQSGNWSYMDPAWIAQVNSQFSDNNGDNKTPKAGNYDNFLGNTQAIYQDLNTMVATGDTVSVTFYIGAAKSSSSVTGGGSVAATFNVGGTNTNDGAIFPSGTNGGGTDYTTSYTYDSSSNGFAADGWVMETLTQTITGAGGDLTLRFAATAGNPFLDNVSEVTLSVPEPASLSLFAAAGISLLGRRRRA